MAPKSVVCQSGKLAKSRDHFDDILHSSVFIRLLCFTRNLFSNLHSSPIMTNASQRQKMKQEQRQRALEKRRSSQNLVEEYVLTFFSDLPKGEMNCSPLEFVVVPGDYNVSMYGSQKFEVVVSDTEILVRRLN